MGVVSDFSPTVLQVSGAALGLLGGAGAGRLADVLPGRYDITLLVAGPARTRRNVALAALGLGLGVWLAHTVTRAPTASLGEATFWFFSNLVLASALLAAAAVDLEHMILPNELTLGGALLAFATSHWRATGLVGSAIGMATGLAFTYLPFVLYKRLRGRSGMGLGDAKLALVAGAWLGAPGAIFVVFAGALQSALSAVIMRVLGVTFAVPASVQAELAELRAKAEAGDEEARAALGDDPMAADASVPGGESLGQMRLPMGPFLVLAALEFLVARHGILALFNRFIAPD